MRSLVEDKKTRKEDGASLVVKVIRALSMENVGDGEGEPAYAVLHRGMVLASRIVAVSTAPYCTLSEEFLVRDDVTGGVYVLRYLPARPFYEL